MKWLSRKLAVVTAGSGLYATLPVIFKHFGVSDDVALASIVGLTALLSYYLKMNKDSKAYEPVTSGTDS